MAKLYFYYSTMNAGKSTALLQAGHNYEERGMRTLLYTALIDSRDGGRIHSRIGIEREARHFHPALDLRAEIGTEHQAAPLSCVLVDESQFLTSDQVKQLARVVDELGVPVLCYGLRTDFRGELFPGSAQLLGWADNLVEIKTICHCGRKAIMVVRVKADGTVEREGAQIEIGGNDRYIALCRKHFSAAMTARTLEA
jgi:thymidine kinase